MSIPICLFFQDLEDLTEVFGGMSAGMSGRKLPLWAEFSFLIFGFVTCAKLWAFFSQKFLREKDAVSKSGRHSKDNSTLHYANLTLKYANSTLNYANSTLIRR